MTDLLAEMCAVPDEYIPSLVDPGRWRGLGVTHWHLANWKSAVGNNRRFDQELVAPHIARGEPCHDPHEAMQWCVLTPMSIYLSRRNPEAAFTQRGWRTPADVVASIDNGWSLLTTTLIPIGGMVALAADGWTAHVHAHPMTKSHCRQH
jgi:hypothetical protein